MARITLLLLILSFSVNAQTYLGNSKEEIFHKSKDDFKKPEISYSTLNETLSMITIIDSYEKLQYYLVNDVCVKFVVTKPYSCNCLGNDIMTYNTQLSSIGKMKWISKDLSRLYWIVMDKNDYSISISFKDDEFVDTNFLTSDIKK